jgi:hypothetical protein
LRDYLKEKFVIRITSRVFTYIITLIINYFLYLKLDIILVGVIGFSTSFIGIFTLFMNLGFANIYRKKNAQENFNDYSSIYFFLKYLILILNFTPLIIFTFLIPLQNYVFNFLILKITSSLINEFTNPFILNLECKLKIIKKELGFFISNMIQNLLIGYFTFFLLDTIQNPLQILGFIYILI